MREVTEVSAGTGAARASAFMPAAVSFLAVFGVGTVLTAVTSLFVYANAVDPNSRDERFTSVLVFGACVSLIIAWIAARRTVEAEQATGNDSALTLLKKYRRSTTKNSADADAGQYSIGEQYLRELLGRRGA